MCKAELPLEMQPNFQDPRPKKMSASIGDATFQDPTKFQDPKKDASIGDATFQDPRPNFQDPKELLKLLRVTRVTKVTKVAVTKSY